MYFSFILLSFPITDSTFTATDCTAVFSQPSTCNETTVAADSSDYQGCQNRTRTGRTCQSWLSQWPHTHNLTLLLALEGNFCRNKNGFDNIWCYTTDPNKRWDYCDPLGDKDVVRFRDVSGAAAADYSAAGCDGRRLQNHSAAAAPLTTLVRLVQKFCGQKKFNSCL